MSRSSPFPADSPRPAFQMNSRSYQASESSRMTGVSGGQSSGDIDLNGTNAFPAMGTRNLDTFAVLRTYGTSQPPLPAPNAVDPISGWYYGQDAPWNPISRYPVSPESRTSVNFNIAKCPAIPSNPAFHDYRNSIVASDCETLPPEVDSGYGSIPKQSVGNPSVYDEIDRSADTHGVNQLSDLFKDFGPVVPFQTEPDAQQTRWTYPNISPVEAHATPKKKPILKCPTCKETVKTPSELRKHENRHLKPHHCNHANCKKSDGFATRNDLARHQRTVHQLFAAVRGGRIFRCTLDYCKAKEKNWPRQDNFKAHLLRVHSKTLEEGEIEDFVYQMPGADESADVGPQEHHNPPRSEDISVDPPFSTGPSPSPPCGPPEQSSEATPSAVSQDLVDEQGSATNPISVEDNDANSLDPAAAHFRYETCDSSSNVGDSSYKFGHEHEQEDAQPDTPLNPQVSSEISCIQPAVLNTAPAPYVFPREATADPSGSRMTSRDPSSPLPESTGELSPSPEYNRGSDSEYYPDSEEDHIEEQQDDLHDSVASPEVPDDRDTGNPKPDAANLIKRWQEEGILERLLQPFGYSIPKAAPGRKSKQAKESDDEVESKKHRFKCQGKGCRKSFPRRCELKKHMKRHDKPYGCTFEGCSKKFGSKNDWKRHENSQHFLLEQWRCDEASSVMPGGICGRIFHRRETFKQHLNREHSLNDLDVQGKWDICRIGRRGEDKFWCGFCAEILAIKRDGRDAWKQRFDHIDDHFSGRRGRRNEISEWKPIESLPADAGVAAPQTSAPATEPPAPVQDEQSLRRASKKRKRDVEKMAGSKRSKVKIWTCCNCGAFSPTKTSDTCIECSGHIQCDNCQVSYARGQEED